MLKKIAVDVGGKTLEMTRLGRHLEQITASSTAWKAASLNFANVASCTGTTIYSVQNTAGIRINSIWTTIEYPLLHGQSIIYRLVSQDGSIQIMP